MARVKMYVYINFDSMWLRGFLDRRNDRLSEFRAALRKMVAPSVRELTPCSVSIIFDEALWPRASHFHIQVCGSGGERLPAGSNTREVKMLVESLVIGQIRRMQ